MTCSRPTGFPNTGCRILPSPIRPPCASPPAGRCRGRVCALPAPAPRHAVPGCPRPPVSASAAAPAFVSKLPAAAPSCPGAACSKAPHPGHYSWPMGRESESGLPVESVYGPGDPPGFDPATKLGEPGRYPFTRGIYPGMYTERPWTIRQYAGFATAQASNARYHQLIAAGTTGLSVAFDLPTQMGYDSDAPIAHGEVGKVGVAIDSIEDMRTLLHEIPLATVSTSMTINAPAAVLLLLYQLVAEEQGVAPSALTGTIQNDILKEYIARGTYIYPPQPSLRLVADTFAYCRREMPRWNTISISGYHMAEAGDGD